jgi:hypothetical protein
MTSGGSNGRDESDRMFAHAIILDADRKAALEAEQRASAAELEEILQLARQMSPAQRQELIAGLTKLVEKNTKPNHST